MLTYVYICIYCSSPNQLQIDTKYISGPGAWARVQKKCFDPGPQVRQAPAPALSFGPGPGPLAQKAVDTL